MAQFVDKILLMDGRVVDDALTSLSYNTLSRNQGVANAGKYLFIDQGGYVVPVSSTEILDLIENGINLGNILTVNQGAENAGKYLVVNSSGNVAPTSILAPTASLIGGIRVNVPLYNVVGEVPTNSPVYRLGGRYFVQCDLIRLVSTTEQIGDQAWFNTRPTYIYGGLMDSNYIYTNDGESMSIGNYPELNASDYPTFSLMVLPHVYILDAGMNHGTYDDMFVQSAPSCDFTGNLSNLSPLRAMMVYAKAYMHIEFDEDESIYNYSLYLQIFAVFATNLLETVSSSVLSNMELRYKFNIYQ